MIQVVRPALPAPKKPESVKQIKKSVDKEDLPSGNMGPSDSK